MSEDAHIDEAPLSIGLSCLETDSIARGLVVLDAMVKRAPVRLRYRGRFSTGKYLIFVDGDVASVEEAHEAGRREADERLLDAMQLSTVHPRLWRALEGRVDEPGEESSILMLETDTVATCVRSLDYALKLVEARVVDFQLAMGIGGRGYFAIDAPLYDLEAVREELLTRIIDAERLVGLEILARPHPEMLEAFGHVDPFLYDESVRALEGAPEVTPGD
jgi:microcompartment protein CcmL/EutN